MLFPVWTVLISSFILQLSHNLNFWSFHFYFGAAHNKMTSTSISIVYLYYVFSESSLCKNILSKCVCLFIHSSNMWGPICHPRHQETKVNIIQFPPFIRSVWRKDRLVNIQFQNNTVHSVAKQRNLKKFKWHLNHQGEWEISYRESSTSNGQEMSYQVDCAGKSEPFRVPGG